MKYIAIFQYKYVHKKCSRRFVRGVGPSESAFLWKHPLGGRILVIESKRRKEGISAMFFKQQRHDDDA